MLTLFDDISYVIPGQDENLPEDRLGLLYFIKANAEKAALWDLQHAQILRKEQQERELIEEETGEKQPVIVSVDRVLFYLGVALSHVTGCKRVRARGEEVKWADLEDGTDDDPPNKLTRRTILLNMGKGGEQINALFDLYVAIVRGLTHEEKKVWRELSRSVLALKQSDADAQSAQGQLTTALSKSSEEE